MDHTFSCKQAGLRGRFPIASADVLHLTAHANVAAAFANSSRLIRLRLSLPVRFWVSMSINWSGGLG